MDAIAKYKMLTKKKKNDIGEALAKLSSKKYTEGCQYLELVINKFPPLKSHLTNAFPLGLENA